MHAEIIATGSELLLGEIVDTNSAFIARRLREIGLNLFYKTIVGDNAARMIEALKIALNRSDVIITTGGLGPTVDDVTREAVAHAIDSELEFRPDLLAQIEARFHTFGVPMSENNRKQAYIPMGAAPIENPVGTAPCFSVEHRAKLIISLPGVPREMEYLIDHAVLPYLKAKFDLHEMIAVRTLHVVGTGESRVDTAIADLETLTNPTVGLSAKAGQIDIRIAAKAATRSEIERLIGDVEAQVRSRIGENIFGADDDSLEGVIAGLLADLHLTLASVELGTGGLISGRLSGARNLAFRGGLVLSDYEALAARRSLANAQNDEAHQAAVIEAAHGIRSVHHSDLALAALLRDRTDGPGLQLFAALVSDDEVETLQRGFGGHTGLAAQWASNAALGLVWKVLKKRDTSG
jgi:competence/damage-inducible protein CinA-like protein